MAERVFPAAMAWWLNNPLRKIIQNPDKILGPYIRENMTVLEPGCATGFFSLPAARMVGPKGKLICVDLQAEMIAGLKRGADKAGLADRMDMRVCEPNSLRVDDLKGAVDFCFAIAVVHEIPDQVVFFKEVAATLKPKATMLVAEPKGHVSQEDIEQSIRWAEKAGLVIKEKSIAYGGRVAVMRKG